MFPGSEVASRFKCGPKKCHYLITFGLSPYFRGQIIKAIREAPCYVVSFDESMNRVTKNEQMDLVVRFWDDKLSQVASRYLGSEFLGHTRSEDLLGKFKQGISELNMNLLLQVSMDGPHVNWKFLEMLIEDRKHADPDIPCLINVGSCSLHVVHGAFTTGASATEWKLDQLLRSLWYLSHDSPARREDFKETTGAYFLSISAQQGGLKTCLLRRGLLKYGHMS